LLPTEQAGGFIEDQAKHIFKGLKIKKILSMLLCKLVVCAPKVALWQANKININYLHICGNIVTWYNPLDCTKFITFGSQ
jgi:hypothetical protein